MSEDVFLKILSMLEKGESQAYKMEFGQKKSPLNDKGEWDTDFCIKNPKTMDTDFCMKKKHIPKILII